MFIAMLIAPSSASSLVTFIFGDSLTEVGNNNYLQLSLAKSNYPHYGVDFDGGKPTGRFTNGKTIGDIICKLINYTIFSLYVCMFSPSPNNFRNFLWKFLGEEETL